MNFAEALHYLSSLGYESLSIKLGLQNVERLLDQFGNPQSFGAPAVQIAGTNGKGSTAAMCEAVCRAAGIRTGLYTSPHLVSITERIHIDGVALDEAAFAKLCAVVREAAAHLAAKERIYPTFFEQVTAIAFLAFREFNVDLMILETGLGGRLDATSVAGARTVALTPIAFDHQEYLGETLAQIAAEKAAIIRPGARAVVAPQPEEARRVIEEQIKLNRAEAHRVALSSCRIEHADALGRFTFSYQATRDYYEHLRLSLPGRHQLINAAVAIELSELLCAEGFNISRAAVAHGLATTRHPGRMEFEGENPTVLFDGAHNAAGAAALRSYLDEFIRRPVVMIFAAMRDKDLTKLASTLFSAASKLILTAVDNPRSASVEDLKHLAAQHFDDNRNVAAAASPAEALHMAREFASPKDLICVTGSLYLVGAVKELWKDEGGRMKDEN